MQSLTHAVVVAVATALLLGCADRPQMTDPSFDSGSGSNPPTEGPSASFQGLGQQFPANFATGVSGDGSVVVGYYFVNGTGSLTHAFRWATAGGFEDLGTLGGAHSEAHEVSFDGSVVVGRAENTCGRYRAFRWTATEGMEDLRPGDPCRFSSASDVSDDGAVIVGFEVGSEHGWFRWTRLGGIQTIGPGTASGVSRGGEVAAGYGNAGFQAFRWTAATGHQQLGTLEGPESFAEATSDTVVVGQSRDKDMFWRAFRWSAGRGMEDLGDLGGPMSAAKDISADGSVIVGTALQSSLCCSGRAFRWTSKRQMQDLKRELLDHGVSAVQNWVLFTAMGISADGTVIAGTGMNPNKQHESWRAVLPLPR